MTWRELTTELSELQICILLFIKSHTLGPNEAMQWKDIKSYIISQKEYLLNLGLSGYSDSTIAVKISRALNDLVQRGFIIKHIPINPDEKPRFYSLKDQDIRKLVDNYFPISSNIFINIPIPLPEHWIGDFFEFKKNVVENPVFDIALIDAFSEYMERFVKSGAST